MDSLRCSSAGSSMLKIPVKLSTKKSISIGNEEKTVKRFAAFFTRDVTSSNAVDADKESMK